MPQDQLTPHPATPPSDSSKSSASESESGFSAGGGNASRSTSPASRIIATRFANSTSIPRPSHPLEADQGIRIAGELHCAQSCLPIWCHQHPYTRRTLVQLIDLVERPANVLARLSQNKIMPQMRPAATEGIRLNMKSGARPNDGSWRSNDGRSC
jgi:hypothetical protein